MGAREIEAEDSPERLVAALGTSVRRHRLYPSGNPLCREAVSACLAELARLETGSLELSVGPDGLAADGRPAARTRATQDLAEAAFDADLEQVVIMPDASGGDIARFSALLARWTRERHGEESFGDALIELGVTAIQVRSVERARLIRMPVLDREALDILELERRTRPAYEVESAVSLHRGWMRVGIDCRAETLDLVDLAFLTDEPRELAGLLESMEEGGAEEIDADRALAERVGELMSLYHRLSPERSRRALRALGDAISTLEAPLRAELASDRLLPELLDAGLSAPILRRLPDDELAGALERLASGAVGAAGLVELALVRLELPRAREAELRRALAPLLDGTAGHGGPGPASPETRIEVTEGGPAEQSLRQYTALDLAVTDEVRDELARIRTAARDDPDEVRLRCLTGLVFLARNPDRIAEVLGAAEPLIRRLFLEDPARATEWVAEWMEIADAVGEARPDVEAAIAAMLGRILDPDVLRELAPGLRDDGQAASLVAAFGGVAGVSILEALETEPDRAVRRALLDFACSIADRIQGGVAPRAEHPEWTVQRNVARILGFAGAGNELTLRSLIHNPERRVTREALLALARIGSPEASEIVVETLYDRDPEIAALAEESIRRLPRDEARRRARELLADPAFYRGRPRLARDLLVRFVARDPERSPVLAPLLRLRYHVWRPAIAGLGWAAWTVHRRGGGR